MMKTLRFIIRLIFQYNIGLFVSNLLLRILCIKNRKQFQSKLTDKYLEFLLRFMDFSLLISRDFRKNIQNFTGKYVFRTQDNLVCSSVIFQDEDMKVFDREIKEWDIMIVFKDGKALREVLKHIFLTGNFDLLDSVLNNKIETIGNLNYAFKFLFLVNNLTRRIGVG